MSFKVTIIDNNNGEVIFNAENAIAIIGAVKSEDSDSTEGIVSTNCKPLELAATVSVAKKSIKTLLDSHPIIKTLLALEEAVNDE